jgi:hypothetical protein
MRAMTIWAAVLIFMLPAADVGGAEKRSVFETDVRPLLKARCFQCHGEGDELSGGLDVRLRRLIISGGDSGAAIEPGDADSSYLVMRLRDGEMPPEGHGDPLTAAEISLVVNWVNQARRRPGRSRRRSAAAWSSPRRTGSTGRFNLSAGRHCRKSAGASGSARRSMPSCWRSWKRSGCRSRRRPRSGR